MRAGEFPDGALVLRAKIDMASPNINLRDPVLYRIRRAHHHRTGDALVHLPDVRLRAPAVGRARAHHALALHARVRGSSPALRLADSSICRCRRKPRQIEFARLNLTYTVMSKRRLLELVEERHVSGWDDPRMPTIVGMRRRGYTPRRSARSAIASASPSARTWSTSRCSSTPCARTLNRRAPRVMGVLDPAARRDRELSRGGEVEEFEVANNPEDDAAGTRRVPFSRVLYIERDDFREDPPKKFFRLAPGAKCGCAAPTSSPARAS